MHNRESDTDKTKQVFILPNLINPHRLGLDRVATPIRFGSSLLLENNQRQKVFVGKQMDSLNQDLRKTIKFSLPVSQKDRRQTP